MKRGVQELVSIGVLGAALLPSAGCYRIRMNLDPQRGPMYRARETNRMFVVGFGDNETVALDKACPHGVSQVTQRQGRHGALLYFLSGAFVDSRTFEVWCKGDAPITTNTPKTAATTTLASPGERSADRTEAQTQSASEDRVEAGIEVGDPVGGEDAAEAGIVELAVLNVKGAGLAPGLADGLTEVALTAAASFPSLKTSGPSDINAMLSLEKQKNLLGCNDNVSCMAEIAGALGVHGVLAISVNMVGSTYVAAFKVIDVRNSRPLLRLTGKAWGRQDLLIKVFEQAVPAILRPLTTE
ncbi:MAG: hypothetical protein HY903_16355 [Deltaproteobacteria bacterium]|nr:hypothetical protein [Deltaproteobacteria bacterium]